MPVSAYCAIAIAVTVVTAKSWRRLKAIPRFYPYNRQEKDASRHDGSFTGSAAGLGETSNRTAKPAFKAVRFFAIDVRRWVEVMGEAMAAGDNRLEVEWSV
jgi:hypothetical protein